jgi:hypothetical protein
MNAKVVGGWGDGGGGSRGEEGEWGGGEGELRGHPAWGNHEGGR